MIAIFMELDLCIKGRRSVRAYEEKPVPKDVVEAILEAGVWAPTGMNRQRALHSEVPQPERGPPSGGYVGIHQYSKGHHRKPRQQMLARQMTPTQLRAISCLSSEVM
jgi:hypothetical protein